MVDSEKMRFFMPGHKIEKVEALIQGFVDNPTKDVLGCHNYRAMAWIAGKILSATVPGGTPTYGVPEPHPNVVWG